MNIDNRYHGVRALPALVKEEPIIFSDITDLPLMEDDVSFLSAAISESLEMSFGFSGIDRRFKLLAVDSKGGLVEDIDIGEQFCIASEVVYIVQSGAPRPAPNLSLQPAVAAAAVDAIDRNYVQSIAAVNTLFVNGNEPKMTSRDVHWLRKCVGMRGDPTRMFFRLAQMYYYYKQLEAQNCMARPTPATANPTHVNSIAGIITSLRAASTGSHFLPFDLDVYSGDAATAVTILRFAAEGTAWPAMRGVDISSILTTPVSMPDVGVLLTGAIAPVIVNPNFHSSEVWDVLHSLAGQLDCGDLAKEMLSTVASQLYSPHNDVDPVFRSPVVRFALPPLNMSYYAVFPVALAADAIVQPVYPDETAMHAQASILTLRAQLLSVAYREVLWSLGLNGKYSSARHAARAAKWRRNLLSRNRRPYAPIVGIMLEYLSKSGCPVSLSQTAATFIPDPSNISGLTLQTAMTSCSSWIDVVDVVEKAPMAALDAYLCPKKSTNLMQPGVRYKLDKVSAASLPSNVAALQDHRATFELIHKQKGDLNWKVSALSLLPGKYGLPADRPFPNFKVDELTTVHVTVTLPDAGAALGMYHNDQRRKDWTWYVSGTGEPPIGDDFDDDPADALGPSAYWGPDALDRGGGIVGTGGGTSEDDRVRGSTGGHADSGLTDRDSGGDMNRKAGEIVDMMRDVMSRAAAPEAKPVVPGAKMSKQDQWTYEDLRRAAPGVLHQAADAFKDAVMAVANQPGRDIYTHMEPLITPVANNLENISFIEAVSAVDKKERVKVMNAAARALKKLAGNTRDAKTAMKLCYGAERALNAAKALKVCACVNTAELAAEGMGWNSEAELLLEASASSLLEHGISLSDFAAPTAVGVDTQEVPLEQAGGQEGDGWRRTRKQDGVRSGHVRMYRPKKNVYPDVSWEGATMLITDAAAEIEARAKHLVDELCKTAQQEVQLAEAGGDKSGLDVDEVTEKASVKPGEYSLPAGLEESARQDEQRRKGENKERREYAVARENVEKQIGHFWAKEKDYNDPLRKEYVHSKRLALEMALENGKTADELSDALIEAIGRPYADFGLAGAPDAATLAGLLEQQMPTESAASDADQDSDEDALGPPPRPSTPPPSAGPLNPDDLPDLETN